MAPNRKRSVKTNALTKPPACRPAAGLLGLLWVVVAVVPASEAFVMPYADLRWLAAIAGLIGALALMAWNERGEIGAGGWAEIIRGRDPLALGAILIAAGLIISSIFSPNPWLGLRIGAREAFLAGAAYCISRRAFQSSEIRWLVWCLIIATGIQAATGLFQAFAEGAGRTAMHGTLEQSEALCDFLGMGTAAAAILAIRIGNERRDFARAVAIVVAVIGAAAIFIAGGRGGALGAVVATVLGLIVFPARDRGLKSPLRRVAFPGLVIVLVMIAIGLLNTNAKKSTLPGRFVEMFDPHSVPVRHRIGLAVISSNMIMDRPLTGLGPGRFAAGFSDMQGRLARGETGEAFWTFNEMLSRYSPNEAHCDPLQWWAEYGLLPCLGMLLMIVSALISGAGMIRKDIDPFGAALWGGLVAWSVVMWFSYPLHDPVGAVFFWGLVGIVGRRGE